RALENDLVAVRCEHAQDQENISIGGSGRDVKSCGEGAGDFQRLRQWRRREGQSVARAVVAKYCLSRRRFRLKHARGGIEIEPGPCCPCERPLVLMPQNEFFAGVADLQLNARLFVPTGSLALQEMAEKALLQLEAIIGVKMRPVGVTMKLEPFLRRRRAHERFGVAPQVQRMAAPICRREERDGDALEFGRAR